MSMLVNEKFIDILQNGTYIDNIQTLYQCFKYQPLSGELYPHEIACLQYILEEEMVFDCISSKDIFLRRAVGFEKDILCVLSLYKRGYVLLEEEKKKYKFKLSRLGEDVVKGCSCNALPNSWDVSYRLSGKDENRINRIEEYSMEICKYAVFLGFVNGKDDKKGKKLQYDFSKGINNSLNRECNSIEKISCFSELVEYISYISNEVINSFKVENALKEIVVRTYFERLKKQDNTIIENGTIIFYISIIDPVAEIILNEYFKDIEKIYLQENDNLSQNYRVVVSKSRKEMHIILFMFASGKIGFPMLYGIPINRLYYHYVLDIDTKKYTYQEIERNRIDSASCIFDIIVAFSSIIPIATMTELTLEKVYGENFQNTVSFAWRDCKYAQKIYNNRYCELAEKGYVNPAWKNEFSLYVLTKSYFGDAIYQYRDSWLGLQSLDVYIPSIRIGIEYQGEQHYREIDYFGLNYEKRKKLDEEKIQKCNRKGITLIEWKYDIPVNDENFRKRFNIVGIELPSKIGFDVDKPLLSKEKEYKAPKVVIYQYDLKGNYIAEYETIREAEKTIGYTGISAVINGKRNSSGGFLWRRVRIGEPKDTILVPDNTNLHSSQAGRSKPVYQIDENGKIINKFKSVGSAAKVLGINANKISAAARGKQKHAGGFQWRYVDNRE